jgi:hypothetical protein
LALAAFMLASAMGTQAFTAVRLCKETVTSGLYVDANEAIAKKQALDDWKAKAKTFGEEYTSWRLAEGRLLTCVPAKSGGHECLARGAPCTIEQAPSRRLLRSRRLDI